MSNQNCRRACLRGVVVRELVESFLKMGKPKRGTGSILRIMGWRMMDKKEAKDVAVSYALGYVTVAHEDVFRAFVSLKSQGSFWPIVVGVKKSPDASKIRPKGIEGDVRTCGCSGFHRHSRVFV